VLEEIRSIQLSELNPDPQSSHISHFRRWHARNELPIVVLVDQTDRDCSTLHGKRAGRELVNGRSMLLWRRKNPSI